MGHIWGKDQLLHHQTINIPNILSLTFSAAISIFRNGTNTLFFCNANIYRSTGTTDRSKLEEVYVSSMKMEKDRAIAADKSNVEVEIT